MKKIIGIILCVLLLLTLTACRGENEVAEEYTPAETPVPVVEEPIEEEEPEEEPHPLARQGEITHIVIHFISNVIENRTDPFIIEDILGIFERYGVNAHYLIDRDGTIHAVVPEYHVAFHAGRGTLEDFPEYENLLNEHSIGIELLGIGTQEEMSQFITAAEYQALDPSLIGFTDAQYIALNQLINEILARHPGIFPDRRHIIGHDEYAPDKPDPGALFDWTRLDFYIGR